MPRLSSFLFSLLLIVSMPISSTAQPEKLPLNLDQLIDEALQNNPEITALRKKWDVFKEKAPQASALDDPMIGIGIVNLPTNFSLDDEDMTMKELSLSQKFPFPGKRRLMREMAENEVEAASKEFEEKVNWIIKEVKVAYFDLSHIYRVEDVTRRNKEILEGIAGIAETRYALGVGIQQDLLKARLEILRMVDELIMLEQKRAALEAKLISLLNRSPRTPMGKPEDIIFRKLPVTTEKLQETALTSNPTLSGLKEMIEAKENAHRLAELEHYPDFNFRVAYGQRDDAFDRTRRDLLTAMIEINLPIFRQSKQARKVAETDADIQGVKARYLTAENEILFKVANVTSMIRRTERQLELYRTGIIPQASLQVSSALNAYRVNKADFMTLLDGQMTLYRYELEYHEALTEYEKNLADLEMIIGEPLSR
ncbi:MAG: TolC family protein [Pseudomonadota bacterium]